MNRHVPNTLSILRIFLSASLFFTYRAPDLFLTTYCVVFLSDIADGMIARRYGLASRTGAALDSLGDFVAFIALTYVAVALYPAMCARYAVWILVVFVVRIAGWAIGLARLGKLVMYHTWSNKAAGAACGILIPALVLFHAEWFCPVALGLASLSSLEEFLLHILTRDTNPDRRSLFFK